MTKVDHIPADTGEAEGLVFERVPDEATLSAESADQLESLARRQDLLDMSGPARAEHAIIDCLRAFPPGTPVKAINVLTFLAGNQLFHDLDPYNPTVLEWDKAFAKAWSNLERLLAE